MRFPGATHLVILSRGKAAEALELDAGGGGADGTDSERKEDEHHGSATGAIRLSGLHIRTALSYGRMADGIWEPVRRRRAVSTDQGKSGQTFWCPATRGPWEEVRDRLNQKLRGWSAYFSYGNPGRRTGRWTSYVYERVRHFLRRRHKVSSRGTSQFSAERCSASWACCGSGAEGEASFVSLR